jgi:hypothetical protein
MHPAGRSIEMKAAVEPLFEQMSLVGVATKLMLRFVRFGTRGAEAREGDSSTGSSDVRC